MILMSVGERAMSSRWLIIVILIVGLLVAHELHMMSIELHDIY